MINTLNRRKFLITGTAVGISSLTYACSRGIRYPRIGFEPSSLVNYRETDNATLSIEDGIFINSEESLTIRAVAPEPTLTVATNKPCELNLAINNIASNAKLNIKGKNIKLIEEQVGGTKRTLRIISTQAQVLELEWLLPNRNSFTFAVIGDTGGDLELQWSIERSKQLGAQFLLHLGDFNYNNGEYKLAIETFKSAQIPVYISIGNHDFNDSGLIYQHFLDHLGPMNNTFTLGGTRFFNMDTAADFFPVNSGHRGTMFKQLRKHHDQLSDQVIFTHRPLENAIPGADIHDHVAGGQSEINWLKKSIENIGCSTILCGHIHHSKETDIEGIQQWTIGEGLGLNDSMQKKLVSKLLIGKVEKGHKVQYSWQSLNMPWIYHRSPKHHRHIANTNPKHLKWFLEKIRNESSKAVLSTAQI